MGSLRVYWRDFRSAAISGAVGILKGFLGEEF